MSPWSIDRIKKLSAAEVRQLRNNAQSRGGEDVVSMCDEVLRTSRKASAASRAGKKPSRSGPQLVSRSKAFKMRGVRLRNPRWSWGGVRESDGLVVFTVWARDIGTSGDDCRYCLWAPNTDGLHPWSDTTGGKERLEQCRLALSQDHAEGILIYGAQRGTDLPLEEASKVTGADLNTVLRFSVRQEGLEYWAIWNGKATEPVDVTVSPLEMEARPAQVQA